MKKHEFTALEKDVLSRMLDNLFTVEGRTVEINELPFTLFECEAIDGSMTCSTKAADEWIGKNIGDISNIVGDLSDTYDLRLEVLENTEKFMVIVVMFVAETLVYELETLRPFIDWDNEDNEPPDAITFDEATINTLTDEITAIIGEE